MNRGNEGSPNLRNQSPARDKVNDPKREKAMIFQTQLRQFGNQLFESVQEKAEKLKISLTKAMHACILQILWY